MTKNPALPCIWHKDTETGKTLWASLAGSVS